MYARIAVAGNLPEDKQMFGTIDLLLGQVTGFLCKDGADAEIQILASPSYTGDGWESWNKSHFFSLCMCHMRKDFDGVKRGGQTFQMDTPLRSLLGEAICDRADVLLAVWNEDVSEMDGAVWEIIRAAYDRKMPCIWISARSKNIYCLWESYYKQYSPKYLENFCEPLPSGGLRMESVQDDTGRALSFWKKRRLKFLKKYKADMSVHPSEKDSMMQQDYHMEEETKEGEPVRQLLLEQFLRFDGAAVEQNVKFQSVLYLRSEMPFIATIFLAVGFYSETLIGKTCSELLPGISNGVVTFATVLAGAGFLIHGLLNLYAYRLSKSRRIDRWQEEFLYDRHVAEVLRVLIHFLPYGARLNLRKLCARDRKLYMAFAHLTDGMELDNENLSRKKIRYMLKHVREMLDEQMAYHKFSIGRYEKIVESLERKGKIFFYIGFAVVLGRGGMQFLLALFPIGGGGTEWNGIVRSFLNMAALLLPAWAGYFSTKMQQNNFRYNLENHQRMASCLDGMLERIANAMNAEDVSIEAIHAMIGELAEMMLVEDTLGWRRQYMGSMVKPL